LIREEKFIRHRRDSLILHKKSIENKAFLIDKGGEVYPPQAGLPYPPQEEREREIKERTY
jgi:hypothetical protein